jgi:hypothetical protein
MRENMGQVHIMGRKNSWKLEADNLLIIDY